MGEAENRHAVERLVAGLNAKDVEVMNEVFVDDSTLSWPQSGELIRGRENRQGVHGAFPSLPTITPYRTVASGDLVVMEAELDYGTETYRWSSSSSAATGGSFARPPTGPSRSRPPNGGPPGRSAPDRGRPGHPSVARRRTVR